MTITPLKQKIDNMFLKNFMINLKQNKKILIIISILQLLGLPMLSVTLTAAAIYDSGDNGNISMISLGFFTLISLFCIGVSIICGIIIAVNNFSYLYKKSQVDMIYSLPIKRKYKFLSDYLSGLAVYLVPYIVACILSIAILLASGVCVERMSGLLENNSFIALIIQGEFAGLLIMTLLYTLTIFVLNCCGTLFESIINILIINILIPGLISVIATMFFADLYGISIFNTVLPVLGYTSPIGAGIYLIFLLATNDYLYFDVLGCLPASIYGKWIVFFLLFTTAVFLLSMFLYMKRKAEDVSKPYVYKFLYYLVITSVLMAISLIARYDITTIVPVIVFSLIVYLIFEVITNRGFKKIYKSFIRYAVTMVSILIVCIIAVGTKGFGVESRIPSFNSIKSVSLSYQGFDRSVVSEYNFNYYEKKYNRIYTQKEVIEKIIEVHEDILDFYYSGEMDKSLFDNDYYNEDYYTSYVYDDGTSETDYPRYSVNFTYKLKTGSTVTRYYILTFEQMKKLFILDSTPQMGDFFEKCIMNDMINNQYLNNKKEVKYLLYISNTFKTESEENMLSKSQAREISEAYGKDYSSMNSEQMLTDNIYCYINDKYLVRESFKNTIECLQKYNLTVPKITSSDYLVATMYPPEALKCWGTDEASASFGSLYLNEVKGRLLNFEQFESMIKLGMLRAPYYEESDCYCVNYDGKIYIIPSKYNDKAESLFKSLNENTFIISKDTLIGALSRGEDINYLIEQYGMEYNNNLYSELTFLQELIYQFDGYVNFNEYYESIYGMDISETTDLDEYNILKVNWDYWQAFNKFYGFATLESYLDIYSSEEDLDKISDEWSKYISVFPELNKQQQ